MEKPGKIAVIGLGAFGSSLAIELEKQGAEVIAVDRSEKKIQEISNKVYNAVCFDCSDETLLRGHGLGAVDLAVIAIGEDFGTNVLVTRMLKDMGVRVISRAGSDREQRILVAVGADEVYRPEHEQGINKARAITYTGVKEYVPLRSGIELRITEPSRDMLNKRIKELDIRRIYGVNIAFFGKKIPSGYDYRVPVPDDILEEGDLLWLIGSREDFDRLG